MMRHWFLSRACAAMFVIAVLAAVPLSAQVGFDAASNSTPATSSTAATINVSWNHTVGLAKKTYLVVMVSIDKNGGAQTVTSVSYGTETGGPAAGAGVTTPTTQYQLTLLGAATNGTAERAEIWGLANPTPGTHQITVTVANGGGGTNTGIVAGARSFSNAFETAAAGTAVTATGTNTTPAVAGLTNSAFDYVVDAVAYNTSATLTAGASQTNPYNVINAAPASSGAASIKTGSANTTMSWSASGTAQTWAHVAVPIQSATPAILFDSVASTRFTSATSAVTGSWSHTTTTAANRYLVVGLSMDLSGRNRNASTVTYGTEVGGPNQAMTLLGSISNGTIVRTELYGLRNPSSGAHTITASITMSGNNNFSVVAGSQSFSGVDQSAPTGTAVNATANSATPTLAVTNLASDYVVDALAFNGNTAQDEGTQQDLRYSSASATITNFTGAGSGLRGYTNATMSYSNAAATAQNWAMSAVPLHRVSVQLDKSVSADVIKLGDSVTYTLTATNYGTAAVTNVTITDAIPTGTTFVSQTGCAGTGPVSCNIGTLNPGQTSAAITMTVLAASAGSFSNSASVTWTGAAASNNSETVQTLAEAKICASPGKDGVGGTLAGIKNDYWPGSATVAAGATSITLGARVAGAGGNTITVGDLLIVMQMQDAAFDTTNDETYGEGTGSTKAIGTGSGAASALNNAGRWEYVVAASAVGTGGGVLTISGGGASGGLLYAYTNQTFATTTTQGQRTFQIIRVPQYTTATLGSTLTALPWNGSVGGVLAVDVSGTLSLGGATVSVNGQGFRGGGGRVLTGDATAGLAYTDFRTLATQTTNGSKGEGIAGTPRYVYQSGATIGAAGTNAPLDTAVEGYVGGSYGRGGAANGGGGSTDGDPGTNQMNSGGGGGGNGGNGGAGGNGWSCNCPGGGQGGASINPSLTRITMGGGGGAGTTNNGSATDATGTVLADSGGPNIGSANGYYSSGGDGGGIVIVRAMQATGTATITANGFNGPNTGRDGPGGGGAGGSVLFTTQTGALTGLTIQAKGGNGGSAWKLQGAGGNPGERHGPGGGGGGGYILLSSAASSTDVSGGTNGTTTTVADPYGAQPGSVGVVQFITGNNVLPGGDGASCAFADLMVTDSVSGVPVGWQQNITFTQTVVNNGTSAADSVVYTTNIPASSTFQSIVPPAGWTCITPAVGGTGNVTCTTATLASGAAASFSLVVQSNRGTPIGYLITNNNTVSSLTPDINPANNNDSAANPVANVDMSVTLTNNATTATTAGSNVIFTSNATNIGTSAATGATWSMDIPPNMSFVSAGFAPPAGWTCITPANGATSGTISCSDSGSLAANAAQTFQPTFKVGAAITAGTMITGTATTNCTNDGNVTNNTATSAFTVKGSTNFDMAATLNAVKTATATGVGTISTTNGSAVVTGSGTAFTKQFTAGDIIFITGQGYFTVASIASDTSMSLSSAATATAAGQAYSDVNTTGTLNNPATGTLALTSGSTSVVGTGTLFTQEVSAGDVVTINGRNFLVASVTDDTHLVLSATAPYTASSLSYSTSTPMMLAPADSMTFTSVVTNNGPNSAPATGAGVQWTMSVPANTNFQSVGTIPPGWVCSTPAVGATSGTITCTLQTAGVNQVFPTSLTSVFTPKFNINVGVAGGTTITGSASVIINGATSGTGDNFPANNTASAFELVTSSSNADVEIVKSVAPNPVVQGQDTNYSLQITNHGPATATNVTISDTLPVGIASSASSVTYNSSVVNSCSFGPPITCSIGTLAVGNSTTIGILVQASPASAGTISNTASITGATQTDPVSTNNSSTAILTVTAVTLARVRDFNATQEKEKVTLVWRTDYEHDNLGFNLYREAAGTRVQINKTLIAGSALTTKQNAKAGYTYRFHDKLDSASAFVQYYLEDVDLHGTRTLHGPYVPVFGAQTDSSNSPPLAGLGTNGYVIASPAGFGVIHDLSLPVATSAQFKQQFELAADSGLKIFVAEEGWYRITKAAMIAAGFDPGTSSKQLSLFMAGIEQPLIVDDGGDNKFDTNDAIEFYGLNLDTVSTGARTYWLRSKNGGSGNRVKLQKDKGAPLSGTSVPFTYEKKERAFYFGSALTDPELQNFFGQVITSYPATQDLPASNVDTSSSANASLELTLQGGPDGLHVVAVSINGHDIGTITFKNQEQVVNTLTFPNSYVVNGTNTLSMVSLSGDYDATALANTRFTYQHLLRADGGALEVSLPGGLSANVGGFATSKVRALDVTDPQQPVELEVTTAADPTGGFIASFTPSSGASRAVVVAEQTRINTAPEMVFNRPSSYNATNGKSGAQLLIVSNNAFLTAAAALQPVREKEGTSTMLIDVDDLYDEFNFGIRGPQAVKTFLQYAQQYKTAPKYLLLVGDASLDPRNYLQTGAVDFVPTKMILTALTKTASDDWLADLDGDGNPDLAIGRLPADSAGEAALMIGKVTSRGTPSGTWAKDVLFVADQPIDFDFLAAARKLQTMVPSSLNTRIVDINSSSSPSSDVNAAMNQGALLVDYIGHGSQELWSGTWAFTATDAQAMTNASRLPVVLAMTCLNGYFFDTYMGSMADSLLKAPNGGAVAVWASSALTEPGAQALMNAEMFRQLFNNSATLGEAAMRAKRATSDNDVKKSWILFGDPSMKLK